MTSTIIADNNKSRGEPKNVVFLIAAIQAFLVSFPSLLLSITNNSDKDSGLELIFAPKEMSMLSTPGLTRDLNETIFWTVTGLSFAYYRIYVDGADHQRLFVLVGGIAKLVAACLLTSWYLQGHAQAPLMVFGVLPEVFFGSYFLTTWWGLSTKKVMPQLMTTTSNQRTAPKNLLFLLASAHIFVIACPSLLLSLTDNTDKDVTMTSMLDAEALSMISAPGLTRDLFRMFNWLLICISFTYYRAYMDGAMQQPLAVAVGALGKLGAACLMVAGYLQGTIDLGVLISGAIPDLLFGIYFLKVWLDMGAILTPPKGKQQ